jgi:hypothetical protein
VNPRFELGIRAGNKSDCITIRHCRFVSSR